MVAAVRAASWHRRPSSSIARTRPAGAGRRAGGGRSGRDVRHGTGRCARCSARERRRSRPRRAVGVAAMYVPDAVARRPASTDGPATVSRRRSPQASGRGRAVRCGNWCAVATGWAAVRYRAAGAVADAGQAWTIRIGLVAAAGSAVDAAALAARPRPGRRRVRRGRGALRGRRPDADPAAVAAFASGSAARQPAGTVTHGPRPPRFPTGRWCWPAPSWCMPGQGKGPDGPLGPVPSLSLIARSRTSSTRATGWRRAGSREGSDGRATRARSTQAATLPPRPVTASIAASACPPARLTTLGRGD